jgi:siroheme synthase-like protein
VVSPDAGDELRALIERRRLVWHRRRWEAGDCRRRHLVFAATDDAAVNAAVAAEAEAEGALVTRADDGDGSTFHVPAALREGDVVVALSTGGAAPLLARRLSERLGAVVTPGVGRAAARLAAVRAQVQARWPHDEARRRGLWFTLITPEFLDAAVAGRDDEVEHRISRCLSQS